jgi:hypothetical protein
MDDDVFITVTLVYVINMFNPLVVTIGPTALTFNSTVTEHLRPVCKLLNKLGLHINRRNSVINFFQPSFKSTGRILNVFTTSDNEISGM